MSAMWLIYTICTIRGLLDGDLTFAPPPQKNLIAFISTEIRACRSNAQAVTFSGLCMRGGGHCIHVNVRHLPAKQREHGISTKLIEFGDRQGTWRGYEL
jgi:hypothetical protein